MEGYESTGLWQRTLGAPLTPGSGVGLATLIAAYRTFRDRAAGLTAQIAKALPNLTIHDVTHLDALWETADLIAGPDYRLTPTEAFVLGGAILLHDAALCFEAYKGGQDGLRRTVEWKDAYAVAIAKGIACSEEDVLAEVDFAVMRTLHASRASDLAEMSWKTPEGDDLFLIESPELRKHYGKLIGDVAASHHWPIEDLVAKLRNQVNSPATLPKDWRVDPVKVACLLRCADAAHIDSRRAPDFLRALVARRGVSAKHWTAQNWLERVDVDTSDPDQSSVIFTSGKAFDEEHSEEWWIAYDAIKLVDRELKACAALLEQRPQKLVSPPFKMTRVTGAATPEAASQHIAVSGWLPQAVEIHVSNLERLISDLGGEKLYGTTQQLIIVLRELIQNARDSISARRAIEPGFVGQIRISIKEVNEDCELSIEDNGVGMSFRVATGSLLDFGTSFWASDIVRSEFPGLMASGYKSVGKYGIGFYSTFMVASSVNVASRRYNAGLPDVTQVKFPSGLSLRPLISIGAPKGFSASTSTLITLTLKKQFSNASNVVISPGRLGYESEISLPMSQCLSILCSGLDTAVELVSADGSSRVVHRPLDVLITEDLRRDWLSRLLGAVSEEEFHPKILAHTARLRPIKDGSRTFGMAALSMVRAQSRAIFGTISTVGGLATVISPSNLASFVGTIDFEPSSARREPSTVMSARPEVIAEWANEQKSLLPPRDSDYVGWCCACCSLAELKLDPIDICTVIIRKQDLVYGVSLDQLIDLMLVEGLAIYQSSMMNHVETNHKVAAFGTYPTLWPVCLGSFWSLERGADGKAPLTSILSCIDRRAQARSISIDTEFFHNVAEASFGKMHVLLLKAKQERAS